MSDIALPLTIRQTAGGYSIEDANGRALCYTYCRDDDRGGTPHWTRPQARLISQMIARSVTDRLEG